MRLLLGVNVDHVATVRQARGVSWPDPVEVAHLAERGGADGITAHLREDRRHIQEEDVRRLRERVRTKLNLELAATADMCDLALRLAPDDACLVPERRQELTTEGGLDVTGRRGSLGAVVDRLVGAGIRVSLFIDPDESQIDSAASIGVPVVELHTGAYAEATGEARERELDRLRVAARWAASAGLQVNAGHGLTLANTAAVAAIPEIVELNIGHSLVSRALFVGMEAAVGEMRALVDRVRAA